MTSERMIASNRSNGHRGRGPRTAAGKASSSQNARRHGLAVGVLNDPAMCSQAEALARIIAGAGTNDALLSRARIVAEAQLDLARIRDVKNGIMNSLTKKVGPSGAVILEEQVTMRLEGGNAGLDSEDYSDEGCCGQDLAVTPTILRQLFRLERYERRAISRRRQAIRAFLVVQSSETNAELP
jgi:hypothetical protein